MSLPSGKLPGELLRRLLSEMDDLPSDVRLGPRLGEDAAALDVPEGVLVAAADPITLTSSAVGAFAVDINANDVAVTGARPRWFLAVVLVPPGTGRDEVERIFAEMREPLRRLGASLVGGHTEITGAVNQPVVVGQMLGTTTVEGLVPTAGARPGDALVQIGHVPVEGASVLADAAAELVEASSLAAARRATDDPGISVVEPALLAADLGATSMHDPTEGGLAAGLHELAHAADVSVTVERAAIDWFDPGLAVCHALGADPWATLASGCVLATFPSGAGDGAVEELRAAGHAATVIGSVGEGGGVVDTAGEPLPWPERDEVARLAG